MRTTPMPSVNRRHGPRMEVLMMVRVETDLFGSYHCLARNLSSGGMFLETPDPLPLGTPVRVHFSDGHEDIVARGMVRNHYFLNWFDATGPRAMAGMSVVFNGFEAGLDCLRRMLH